MDMSIMLCYVNFLDMSQPRSYNMLQPWPRHRDIFFSSRGTAPDIGTPWSRKCCRCSTTMTCCCPTLVTPLASRPLGPLPCLPFWVSAIDPHILNVFKLQSDSHRYSIVECHSSRSSEQCRYFLFGFCISSCQDMNQFWAWHVVVKSGQILSTLLLGFLMFRAREHQTIPETDRLTYANIIEHPTCHLSSSVLGCATTQ